MQNITTRFIVLFAILAVLSATTAIMNYETLIKSEPSVQSVAQIPVNIGHWSGRDVALEEWVYRILETRSIVHRNYHSRSGNVFLSIVYYADTKVDFHAPEACLGAQGLELVKKDHKITLANGLQIDANELVYGYGNAKELVYYFYKSGSYLGGSYVKLRMNIALNKLTSGPKSGALIRVSTSMANGSQAKADQLLTEFLNTFVPIAQTLL